MNQKCLQGNRQEKSKTRTIIKPMTNINYKKQLGRELGRIRKHERLERQEDVVAWKQSCGQGEFSDRH